MTERIHKQELIEDFLGDVLIEVLASQEQHGIQDHLPTGCGTLEYQEAEQRFRKICQENSDRGMNTLADILLEEVYEALGAATPANAYKELVQVASVAAWFARRVTLSGLE